MDTNDNIPSGNEPETGGGNQNNYSANYGYGSEQSAYGYPPQLGTQGGYGPNGYYGNMQQPKKPERKRGKGFLIAIFMVLCFIAGGFFTGYVIMPALDGVSSDVAVVDASSSVKPQSQAQNNAVSQTQGALTTDSVDIGGETPEIADSDEPIVQIATAVCPSVVGVTVSSDQMTMGQQSAEEESGYGTGVIITDDGYIVTNNHVVAGSDSVKITLYDGTEYEATIVGTDATTDIAVVKIEATGLTAAALGDSSGMQVGQSVVAIGNPLGLDLANSVTSGIVSALNREIKIV